MLEDKIIVQDRGFDAGLAALCRMQTKVIWTLQLSWL